MAFSRATAQSKPHSAHMGPSGCHLTTERYPIPGELLLRSSSSATPYAACAPVGDDEDLSVSARESRQLTLRSGTRRARCKGADCQPGNLNEARRRARSIPDTRQMTSWKAETAHAMTWRARQPYATQSGKARVTAAVRLDTC